MIMKTNFIGCGKLGRTLAKLLTDKTDCEIAGVLTQSLESAQTAVDFISQGIAVSNLQEIPDAELICIASGDEAIQVIAEQLDIKPGQIVVHFSGALPSSILDSAKAKGALIAAVHPIKSFAEPAFAVLTFENTPCSFEGDAEAIAIVKPLFEQLGAKCIDVDPEHKMRYHAACVMATNYLVTLSHIASECFEQSGMAHDDAIETTTSIMQSTLDNLKSLKIPAAALTGPIARGEADIVAAHIEALEGTKLVEIYKALGNETLTLTEHNQVLADLLKPLS